jgi:hypothetical protein
VLEVLDKLGIMAATEALPAQARSSVERMVAEELAALVEILRESGSRSEVRPGD